ncbi:GxxExxY protein [Prevotella scopos JCM 17725]|uniref:GxxExxY protein n=1 Tax=Prevotella scopos JCM 17725 TaxID=1236518 RepID=A0AAX2F6D7_9BACT|nr:GxxExxY protein [Prevotella scopos]ANR72636.1 GxxExxY protein [Prevotella scopos JCM 17725]QUB45148.1 GxxExxY protein [Prevotella scopos JCM 17725]SHG07514.1 GxxExxY protein [Prevotella scopos JCM 17725]
MKEPDIITTDQLITEVIECAKRIRRQLGPGFLEKVYKNAMVVELRKLKLNFETEKLIQVLYDGIVVGEYRTDIIVEGRLILELKATQDLSIANEVQLVNYLTSTQIDDGLLINFGADKLQFKRKYRIYRKL